MALPAPLSSSIEFMILHVELTGMKPVLFQALDSISTLHSPPSVRACAGMPLSTREPEISSSAAPSP
jgi:hypothetical protein